MLIFHSWERASVCFAKGCWCGQIVRHVNGYCKDQQRDSRFLNASLCPSCVKGASFTLTAFFESNHTNLIRVVCPRSYSGCWAAVRPLFPYLPWRKVLTYTSSLWNPPPPFPPFPSNLIYHTLLVFLPASVCPLIRGLLLASSHHTKWNLELLDVIMNCCICVLSAKHYCFGMFYAKIKERKKRKRKLHMPACWKLSVKFESFYKYIGKQCMAFILGLSANFSPAEFNATSKET